MKRIQLWKNVIENIHSLTIDGTLSEATYYHYCSKFLSDVICD